MQGMSHLQGLTGTRPGRWEKEKKFLARVLVPEDAHVKIGAPKKAKKAKICNRIADSKFGDRLDSAGLFLLLPPTLSYF